MQDRFFKVILLAILLIILVAIFYRLRLYFAGIKTTSWWRGVLKNNEVGGKNFSLHLIGFAYDVIPVDKSTLEKLKIIGFSKIINEKTHYHVQII